MTLLSEYEQGTINSRVFKLGDSNYQVIVFNTSNGQEMAKFFMSYEHACNFAESRVLLNE